jgi:hypothetical protein
MTPKQIQYARELSHRLMAVTALATAAGAGRGVDTNGNPIKGIEERLAKASQQIAAIAKWAEENKP